ncbi:MAG: twin-arginine translocase TatA/TatE family subunit [Selenomonadaceae bacterium]|nr:twin-arginine translocase TatA/TatE family subunit [Selenomonadaceae bacterium]
MFGIGAGEFVVILIVALIVFGPSKLPEVGRAIGKGIREFRKAQAALSKTLDEVDITGEKSVEKSSPVEKPAEKSSPVEKSAEKSSPVEKSAEKSSPVEKSAENSSSQTITADDMIKIAKESPLVKENHHEKISDGNPVDAAVDATRSSSAGAKSSSNGVDKQS